MRLLRRIGGLVLLGATLGLAAGPARAETMKECSVKFQAAKKAGTLNGADWKTFRAAQCGGKVAVATASANATGPSAGLPAGTSDPAASSLAPAAGPGAQPGAAPAAAATSVGAATTGRHARTGTAAADTAAPVPTGDVKFPGKVDTKYASLTPGKARMKTCDDQYKLNKADGGNGGLKWLQKGGGYYSACVKRLKAG